MATPEDLELIRAGYHANWLPEKLRNNFWECTLTREPYFVKFRGHDLKTRPKINFADPNERGEFPLYRWGQERKSYDLVEKIHRLCAQPWISSRRSLGPRPTLPWPRSIGMAKTVTYLFIKTRK